MTRVVGVLGLTSVLVGCGGTQKQKAASSTSTTESIDSTANSEPETGSNPSPSVPSTVANRGTGPAPRVSTTAPRPPQTSVGGDVAPSVGTIASGETRIRADVESVDLGARTFRLTNAPSGVSVVVVTDSTRFTLAEGDPATFDQVQTDSVVSVTGTVAGPDRILAHQVVILSL